jgi:hypothetical protein
MGERPRGNIKGERPGGREEPSREGGQEPSREGGSEASSAFRSQQGRAARESAVKAEGVAAFNKIPHP